MKISVLQASPASESAYQLVPHEALISSEMTLKLAPFRPDPINARENSRPHVLPANCAQRKASCHITPQLDAQNGYYPRLLP